MLRLFFLAVLVALLTGLVPLGLSDTKISIANTSISNNEITSSVSNHSSASATITITMTGVSNQ